MAVDHWTKEQTIVVLRAYFIVPFNRASNKQPEILKTAEIIGRKPSSVKMKIGNFGSLDPELAKHGIVGLGGTSKLDREVWEEYANDREKLAEKSEQLITEFSHSEIDYSIREENSQRKGEDVLRLTKTRTYQSFFRESVIGIYDTKCCITGLQIPELLVASHIIPWAKDSDNRLNPENGLCLNSLHDRAFDIGLLTITTDYKVLLSERLFAETQEGVVNALFKTYEGSTIKLPERYHPDKAFLDYHNNHIFQK